MKWKRTTSTKAEAGSSESDEDVYWYEYILKGGTPEREEQLQKLKSFQQKILALPERDPIMVSLSPSSTSRLARRVVFLTDRRDFERTNRRRRRTSLDF